MEHIRHTRPTCDAPGYHEINSSTLRRLALAAMFAFSPVDSTSGIPGQELSVISHTSPEANTPRNQSPLLRIARDCEAEARACFASCDKGGKTCKKCGEEFRRCVRIRESA